MPDPSAAPGSQSERDESAGGTGALVAGPLRRGAGSRSWNRARTSPTTHQRRPDMTITHAEAAAHIARRNEAALPDKPRSYLRHQEVSWSKSDPLTKGRSVGIVMIDSVPAA